MEQKSPQDTVNYYCELAIKHAGGFGKNLDYSEESIKDVEGILGFYSQDLHPGFIKKIIQKILKEAPTENQISSMAIIWGSYIGETLKRKSPISCEWKIENVFGDGDVLHLNIGGTKLFPIEKVYKRLINGSEDNVWSFYSIFKEKIEKKEI